MIELNKEAEEYADKQSNKSMRSNDIEYSKSGEELYEEAKTDFIAGATSNYVKQQILRAKIKSYLDCLHFPNKTIAFNKLEELQQELKQLQDE
jgi:phosphopantothenoylcysteine synthetase/decarboxylase